MPTSKLSPVQQENASIIIRLAEGKPYDLSPDQAAQLVGAAYAESGLSNYAVNPSSGAAGLFQLLSPGYVTRANQLGGVGNPVANTEAILPSYSAYFAAHPDAQPGQAAAAVEASGEPASWYAAATGTVSNLLEGGKAGAGILGTGLNQNASSLGSTLAAGAQHIPGVVQTEQLFNGLSSFWNWIGKSSNWIRIGEIIAGAVLIMLGIIMLGRGAASSSPAAQTRGAIRTARAAV
jgi:hypothetical protein